MWISSNLLKLTIYFVGSCCQLVGFLSRDPSLICNTELKTKKKNRPLLFNVVAKHSAIRLCCKE